MKTMLKVLAIAILAGAMGFASGRWYFNEFLFLEFWGDPAAYAAFVAGGAPCYAWVGSGRPDSAQPECWYDPGNMNPGYGGGDRATKPVARRIR